MRSLVRAVASWKARARGLALLVVAGALASADPVHGQTPASRSLPSGLDLPVVEDTLANGLRLLVLPRPGAPTVSFVVQYGVGGVHEHRGTTGTAHLLEHLLFKGSETLGTTDPEAERRLFRVMDAVHDTVLLARASEDEEAIARLEARIEALEDSARTFVVANEFDRVLTRAGARGLNATTDHEATTYFVELPANRTELWFALEGDRMAHPVFREFYTERDVVVEERRMRVETSPGGLLYEGHLATAFQVHPYGQPVVGYRADLATLTREEVADYYRRFYGAGNAVVTVVGDVDTDQVRTWAEEYLGPVRRGERPPPVLAKEPEQQGERRIIVRFDAEPQLRIGWHVPSSLHPDAPALSVLTTLLTGGRTSRLHRRLVLEDRLATGVFAGRGPGQRFPTLFTVSATPRAPHTPAEVETAIYEELERLARDGPTASELERVHNRMEAAAVRRLSSNLGLAFQIAGSEALYGDWRETFRLTEQIQAVDAEDVRRVAAAYLTADNRTVATLLPESDGSEEER